MSHLGVSLMSSAALRRADTDSWEGATPNRAVPPPSLNATRVLVLADKLRGPRFGLLECMQRCHSAFVQATPVNLIDEWLWP